jgi:hypothetical protein
LSIAGVWDISPFIDVSVPFDPFDMLRATSISAPKGRGVTQIARRCGTALSQERQRQQACGANYGTVHLQI